MATAPLRQDVSAAADLVSNLDGYESELVRVDATISGAFATTGSGHVSASSSTAGLPADPNLRLRLPTTLHDELDLAQGCSLTLLAGPMWRFAGTAQPSAYAAEDLQIASCPGPTVVSAVAPSATSVVVTFDRTHRPRLRRERCVAVHG